MSSAAANVPVIILSGGYGIYLDDSGVRKSKGNVELLGRPMIYYVILSYLQSGFREFYITGSYQLSETENLLKKSFPNGFEYKGESFSITFRDSGLDTRTGDRLKGIFRELKLCEYFAVTYSDTISTLKLSESLRVHIDSQKMGTLTGTRLPTRFRILGTRPGESLVRGFAEKPINKGDYINGGFYFFRKEIMDLGIWGAKDHVVLETDLLDLLVARAELSAFVYEGDWHHLDCERDLRQMEKIAKTFGNI